MHHRFIVLLKYGIMSRPMYTVSPGKSTKNCWSGRDGKSWGTCEADQLSYLCSSHNVPVYTYNLVMPKINKSSPSPTLKQKLDTTLNIKQTRPNHQTSLIPVAIRTLTLNLNNTDAMHYCTHTHTSIHPYSLTPILCTSMHASSHLYSHTPIHP